MKNKGAVKYLYNANPLYVHFKKHYCPNCKTILKIDYESKIVNSYSPEAIDYDFSIGAGDSNYYGDVEFRTSFFRCPKCNTKVLFGEMSRIEKSLKDQ